MANGDLVESEVVYSVGCCSKKVEYGTVEIVSCEGANWTFKFSQAIIKDRCDCEIHISDLAALESLHTVLGHSIEAIRRGTHPTKNRMIGLGN